MSAAKTIRDAHKTFDCLNVTLRIKLERVADGRVVEYWEDIPFDVALATTEKIAAWNAWATAIVAEAEAKKSEVTDVAAQVELGEILIGWRVWHRIGGATDLG